MFGLTSNYIIDFIIQSTVVSRHQDRISSAARQLIPVSHQKQLAERGFAVAGPMLWNALPTNVRDAMTYLPFIVL